MQLMAVECAQNRISIIISASLFKNASSKASWKVVIFVFTKNARHCASFVIQLKPKNEIVHLRLLFRFQLFYIVFRRHQVPKIRNPPSALVFISISACTVYSASYAQSNQTYGFQCVCVCCSFAKSLFSLRISSSSFWIEPLNINTNKPMTIVWNIVLVFEHIKYTTFEKTMKSKRMEQGKEKKET